MEKEKIFCIAAPTYSATGGPLLLHQFCYKLRQLGKQACMYYYGEKGEEVVHPFYKKFNNPYITELVDDENLIYIFPEVFFGSLSLLKKAKTIIWWLSVDNFWTAMEYNEIDINQAKLFFQAYPESLHFTQCKYIKDYVINEMKIPGNHVFMLSDYLDEAFVQKEVETRKNIVLYNPKKGLDFTKKLIKEAKGIAFVPIEYMTPEEVSAAMHQAKVYVDFGNHPGKDRMPREAARSGCIIITNKKGSAAYQEDVSIPEEYKFEHKEEMIPLVIEKIKQAFKEYETRIRDFGRYRLKINHEEKQFNQEILEFLKTID